MAGDTKQGRPKYWDDIAESETHRAQLKLVPHACRVLEIGPGPGHMTAALRARGCQITAIEADPSMAELVRAWSDKVFTADIEAIKVESLLGCSVFDVILLGDVLEHLVRPATVLVALKRHLADGGYLVVSMPHVAHASVRLALLQGQFEYQSEGLLDATHLRFFTFRGLEALFEEAGYRIVDVTRIRKGLFDTSVRFDPLRVPAAALRALGRDADALTFQFVFRAELRAGEAAVVGPTTECFTMDIADEYVRLAFSTLRVDRNLYRAVRLAILGALVSPWAAARSLSRNLVRVAASRMRAGDFR